MVLIKDIWRIRAQDILWKIVLGISVSYQIFLMFLLTKSKKEARDLKFIDSSLGVPLPERSYAENCSLNLNIIKNQLDGFVISHILGSYIKALLFRDYWICWINSIMFEILEYSLQHQLPNFAECWWDHWILDVTFCNALGIYFGMKTCQYFKLEQYHWKEILRKKRKNRLISFFSYILNWSPGRSFRHYIILLFIIWTTLECELNVFYLKYLLWIPPEHYLVSLRLLIFSLVCSPAIKEFYYYYIDPEHNRLGAHAFFMVANIWTESIIALKFSYREFPNSVPFQVKTFWSIFLSVLIIYPIIKYYTTKKINKRQRTD
ncbi:hypothetical protein I4U23_000103 [Adineta vaga]|nr:hypothetical protein I4U23_000103 [Adineta vaga]